MGVPQLKSCCCCGTLRTGSIITGILGIILSILTIAVIVFVRVDFKTVLFDFLPQSIIRIILIINFVMTILISILMIVGVIKRNMYMMLPWVVLGFMLVIGLIISVIYTAVVYFIDGFIVSGILWLIFGIVFTIIYAYLWLVVFSYFTIVREESERGQYSKQPYRR